MQSVSPFGHAQDPATQSKPSAHALPHAPQFCVLVVRSTHCEPHFVSPPLHPDVVHAPFEHASPFGHLLPHAPQLLLSMLRSTHVPLHDV